MDQVTGIVKISRNRTIGNYEIIPTYKNDSILGKLPQLTIWNLLYVLKELVNDEANLNN